VLAILLPILTSILFSFSLLLPPPPTPTLFPYTTLFRSESPAVVITSGIFAKVGGYYAVVVRLINRKRKNLHHILACNFADPFERSEEHTSELQSLRHLVCRLLLEKKKKKK